MVKKGDFIRIELEGRKEDGVIFDSTKGEVAKKLHKKEGPLLVVYKYDRLVKGIEDALEKMKEGEEKELHLTSENSFGKRKKNLVKVFPLTDFQKNKLMPKPGATIHIDTKNGRIYGTIKSVNGGRVMIDFNHPLAGENVSYKIKLVKVYDMLEDKIKELLTHLGIDADFTVHGNNVNITIDKKTEDYETKKQILLLSLKTRLGINKIEMKEKGE
ncbi:FKBP-type peptidyl-prolyl cis-trans isomerase [Candidatus Micrarchaeota archaeon]|nr:FKBP-type peptidyl-prolyl cis-trans isomerase [Candidatus Micrarchaeota archaeon]